MSENTDITELSERVLAVLQREGRPLSAGAIARELWPEAEATERQAVGRALAGLGSRVCQDGPYRWALAAPPTPVEALPMDRNGTWERFSALLSYYLDCVREDHGRGASAPLDGRGVSWLPLPSDCEWSLGPRTIELPLAGASPLVRELRQGGTTLMVRYGYPVYLDRRAGTLVPVFLQAVEAEVTGGVLSLSLVPEWPRVNPDYLRRALRTAEEQRCFLDDLGLLAMEGDPPEDGLSDVVRRLVQVGAPSPILEPLEPERLASEPSPDDPAPDASQEQSTDPRGAPHPAEMADAAPGAARAGAHRSGIVNRAVLLVAERPRYTTGLEAELLKLRDQVPDATLSATALHTWVTPGAPWERREAPPLVEVVPLNDEQRAAVRSAFEQPLTVVTGPPGTGKSQVVQTVLANAWLRGQRVLFASRNHKAVDVVEERLVTLAGHPVAIRTGSRGAGRDFRKELVAHLSQLLALDATEDDRAEFRASVAQVERLTAARDEATEPAAIAALEKELWAAGASLLRAAGRRLPDRLTAEVRLGLSEYRATLERLLGDEIGGRAYARLRAEQEGLFPTISRALPVWCVTNLSARGALPFEPAMFDLVVIDEASQCDIPSALPLLFRARAALIIGDPRQLRHVSTLEPRRDQQIQAKHGLLSAADMPWTYGQGSLFDLAAGCLGERSVVLLREHFRSHAAIVAFSNDEWYQGLLRVRTDYRRLRTPEGSAPGIRWTDLPSRPWRPATGGAISEEEASRVVAEVAALLNGGYQGTVGVVTPFRAQADRIRRLMAQSLPLPSLERAQLVVDTAHGLQGDERDVVLLSPCIGASTPPGALRFLGATANLLNVAITRARAVLHVVGDLTACRTSGIPHIERFANWAIDVQRGQVNPGDGDPADRDPRVGPWEKSLHDALVAAGLRPERQHRVDQYRVDLGFPEQRLAVEVDGDAFHLTADGDLRRADRVRDQRLASLGWAVLRVSARQVRDDLEGCVSAVRERLTQ